MCLGQDDVGRALPLSCTGGRELGLSTCRGGGHGDMAWTAPLQVDAAGGSVSGAGDVDDDGRPDVIIGAPHADNNDRYNSGSAFVGHPDRRRPRGCSRTRSPCGHEGEGAARASA